MAAVLLNGTEICYFYVCMLLMSVHVSICILHLLVQHNDKFKTYCYFMYVWFWVLLNHFFKLQGTDLFLT